MELFLNQWVNIILAISFLIPGISRSQNLADASIQSTTIHLPLVMNQPQGMVYIAEGQFLMGCHHAQCLAQCIFD
jgi:hypothetical protein